MKEEKLSYEIGSFADWNIEREIITAHIHTTILKEWEAKAASLEKTTRMALGLSDAASVIADGWKELYKQVTHEP